MAPRIERALGAVFGLGAVKRKDSPEKDSGQDKKQEHDPQSQNQSSGDEHQRSADRQSVEKALTDLRTTRQFDQTGMRVEVLETKDGLRVRLAHADGTTVKVLTAEDFIKLKETSTGDQTPRGKILDQKF